LGVSLSGHLCVPSPSMLSLRTQGGAEIGGAGPGGKRA
jgi:hypothetical protein